MAYRIFSDVYNQRLHSHYLCENSPATQAQYVPDNNLTVADLLIAAVSGPEALWFLKTEKRPGHGLRALHLTISDMYWIASLGNLVLISLERLHATLYTFRHCLVGKRIYYKIIISSWLGALTVEFVLHIIRMNDSALADRYPWLISCCSYSCSANNILRYNNFKIY